MGCIEMMMTMMEILKAVAVAMAVVVLVVVVVVCLRISWSAL